MTERKDISVREENGEYIIEVYAWDYDKVKTEQELAKVDNISLKKVYLKIYRTLFTNQFHLSDNQYFDSINWLKLSRYLSEKGEAIITRIAEGEKVYYTPAKIFERNSNKIVVEYQNGEKREFTNPKDYCIIRNNPEGKPNNFVQIEKILDTLVSNENEIVRDRINWRSKLVILINSRIPTEEEIETFRNDFKSDEYAVRVPYGTKSIKYPTLSKELGDKENEIRRILAEEVDQEIKNNKEVKFAERLRALNEIKEKWGIELTLETNR